MIRHLVRLTWNRKRSTALVFLELVGCFLVLCAVVTGVVFTVDNWRRPLGFEYADVWRLELSYGEFYRASDDQRQQAIEGARRVLDEVRVMPEVEAVGLMENSPYVGSTSSWTFEFEGEEANVHFASVSVDLPRAMRFHLLRGR